MKASSGGAEEEEEEKEEGQEGSFGFVAFAYVRGVSLRHAAVRGSIVSLLGAIDMFLVVGGW